MRGRCLIADDHPALLAAVGDFLERNGFEVVARVSDGASALAGVERTRPDVAIVDYRMPRMEGRHLLAELRVVAPDMRIAVYTADAEDGVVADALRTGADAIILKDAPLADLLRALDAVQAGDRYVDPALARAAMGVPAGSGAAPTRRELEVLSLLADGLSHDEMAKRLSISPETVRTHVRKACDRLGAATRTQAVATALRRGLIG